MAACAAPAAAQSPAPARDAAQVRAEADALLAGAHAGRAFDDRETDAKAITLRHRSSGVRCVMEPGSAGNAVVVAGDDDVTCVTRLEGLDETIHILRAGGLRDADLMARAEAALKVQRPSAKLVNAHANLNLTLVSGGRMSTPNYVAAVYASPEGPDRLIVGTADGWAIVVRVSGGPNAKIDALTDLIWVTSVQERRYYLAHPH
jgi:hypothetical protein